MVCDAVAMPVSVAWTARELLRRALAAQILLVPDTPRADTFAALASRRFEANSAVAATATAPVATCCSNIRRGGQHILLFIWCCKDFC